MKSIDLQSEKDMISILIKETKSNGESLKDLTDLIKADIKSRAEVENYTKIMDNYPLSKTIPIHDKRFDKTTGKTYSQKIAKDESELNENEEKRFINTQLGSISIAIIMSALSTYISFIYMQTLFPYAVALFVPSFAIGAYLLFDYLLLPGNTLKRISNNAIACAIFAIGIFYLFGIGFEFGNSYVGNKYGNEQRVQTDRKPDKAKPAVAPDNGTIRSLERSERESER